MDSWDSQTPSPDVKFEASPAESFLSMPGEMYPPLFGTPAPTTTTMNPQEIMTPRSFAGEKTTEMSALTGLDSAPASSPAPSAGEKRPVKKRKSWGQVLPEPKTNLPPRKRAKTEDEKEQRRVERVLRNRRAAQSSRERKRLEVEALEERNKELEVMLLKVQNDNLVLYQELSKLRGNSGVVARNPITFSQELFSSQDGHNRLLERSKSSLDELMMTSQSQTTINPTSLSPTLSPVPDVEEEETEIADIPAAEADLPAKPSADLTQHPAVVLCSDLQCQSVGASRAWMASQQPLSPALALYCQLTLLLTSTSTLLSICKRPLTQIAMSLKAGFSLPPTPALLNTIVWLVTKPSPSRTRTSTSTISSTTKQTSHPAATSPTASRPRRLSTTLRLKLLRKILTCSPMLARPLTDATMAALRLVRSEETLGVSRVRGEAGSPAKPGPTSLPEGGWLNGATLPSRGVLLTLLWALKVEERRIAIRERDAISPSSSTHPSKSSSALKSTAPTCDQKIVLRIDSKRRWEDIQERRQHSIHGEKRRRLG